MTIYFGSVTWGLVIFFTVLSIIFTAIGASMLTDRIKEISRTRELYSSDWIWLVYIILTIGFDWWTYIGWYGLLNNAKALVL